MVAVDTTTQTQAVQPVTPAATSTDSSTSTTSTSVSGDFEALLKGMLGSGSANQVSEEALFAAVTEERIGKLKGTDVAKQYHDILTKNEDAMKHGSYIPYEDAARTSLMDLQKTGALTAEEADKIHAEAFDAAQLDDNANALYDDIGGPGDATKAVMGLADAMKKAEAKFAAFDAGTATAAARPLAQAFSASGSPIVNPYDTGASAAAGSGFKLVTGALGNIASQSVTPTGTKMDGTDGFLWKPISDHGGKAVILIPHDFTADIDKALLKDANGNVIEEGYHWTGFTPEGDPAKARMKFEFKKPGAQYPKGGSVDLVMKNGSIVSYKIPDPSKRYD